MLALRAIGTQPAIAPGTEVETTQHRTCTARANPEDWLPQNEVQDNSQAGCRNQDRDGGPEHAAHAPAARITIHVADKQHVNTKGNPGQQSEQDSSP